MGSCSLALALATLLLPIDLLAAAPADSPTNREPAAIEFDLEAQPLADALKALAVRADLQIIFTPGSVRALRANAIKGWMMPEAALQTLLEGTNLEYVQSGPGVFVVRMRPAAAPVLIEGSSKTIPVRAPEATTEPGAGIPGSEGREIGTSKLRAWELAALGAIRVTGTHIRGTAPVGAQVISITRSEIHRSGYATVQDVVRALPQNFGGGPSEDTLRIGMEAQTNSSAGTALNLRGLGAGATLLLVNGRRLAPGGSEGAFTDASNIPLTAVERIDVFPDGASALYGSDAVGGVVNVILRDDYDGAETQARVSTVTQGALIEQQLSQVLGTRWDSGSGLLSFEYYDRGALPAADRRLAVSDLRRFGGSNFDTRLGNPGTLIVGTQTWAIPPGQDGTSLAPGDLIAGTVNLYDQYIAADIQTAQERWSLLGTVQHRANARFSLFADAFYSERRSVGHSGAARTTVTVPATNPFYVNPTGGTGPVRVGYGFLNEFGSIVLNVAVRSTNLALGVISDPGAQWKVTGYMAYTREQQDQDQTGLVNFTALNAALSDPDPVTAFNPFGAGSNTNPATLAAIRRRSEFSVDSDLKLANITADGPLFQLRGGEVKLAIGADYRRHAFAATLANVDATGTTIATQSAFRRDVAAAFGEFFVPLVGAPNARAGFERLAVSAAARYERYDDFGSTAVPRFGLVWSPLSGIAFRGTWSESFRAPNLADLSEDSNTSLLFTLLDSAAPSGSTTALLWFGKNADLREETATSWTLGAELKLPALSGLSIGLTYFENEFNGRVQTTPFANDFLAQARAADLVIRAPDSAQRDEVCRRSRFLGNAADCRGAPIGALIDLRLRNVAITRTRGFDLLGSYEVDTSWGHFNFDLNTTWLLEFSQARALDAPLFNLLDTQNNPLDFRLRSSASWSRRGFGATAFINYADDYRDTVSQPNRKVASWTTFDLQLSYRVAGTQFSLNVRNLLDTQAPFLNNTVGIGYDQENADLLGRLVSLQVRKDW